MNGSTVAIVDTTNFTADQAALGLASATVFQAVNQQLNRPVPAPQPIKLASTELTPGMLHQDAGPSTWGHVVGGASHTAYGDDKVKIGLQGGPATNYGLTGTNTLSGGYVGASGRISLSLVGDVEYSRSSRANDATVGYLGVEYRF